MAVVVECDKCGDHMKPVDWNEKGEYHTMEIDGKGRETIFLCESCYQLFRTAFLCKGGRQ